MSKQPHIVGALTPCLRFLVCFALVGSLLLAAPASLFAEPDFTFRGRGNGHGVGMSQYGARGFATQGFTYDRILSHYYRGTSLGRLSEGEMMRVALERTDTPARSWTFTAPHASMSVDWSSRGGAPHVSLLPGVAYRLSTDGSTSNVTITNVSTGVVVHTLIGAAWLSLSPAYDNGSTFAAGLVRVHDASGPQRWTNVLYPGRIFLVRSTGGDALHLRNLVEMEDYVKCVVPREMPTSWQPEALKAQAVAARSYAYKSKRSAASFDVWCTVSSQVYNGWGRWVNEKAVRHNEIAPGLGGDWGSDPAVDATRGQVATHDGSPISAFFFSTSGGHTESSENIWSEALPYTRGTPDPYEHLAGSPWHSLPDISLTAAEVRLRLLAAGFAEVDLPPTLSGIRVVERGTSGRVLKVELMGTTGETRTITDVRRFRTAISDSRWNTTWFYVNPKTERIAGPDRHATSVEASKRAFRSADQVVLAGGRSAVDALSAAAFAASLPGGAPVLLTERTRLTPVVKAEIERLGASKAYIVGGSMAVSSTVEAELSSVSGLEAPGRIERIGGETRYETAQMLAERVLTANPGGRVFIVNGDRLADALAVSPVAYARRIPIVPIREASVPPESAAVLEGRDVTQSLVVGGTAALSDEVMSLLPGPKRIADGVCRYDTAAKIAAWAIAEEGFSATTTYMASGTSLVDALASAPLMGGWRHPVLFSRSQSLPAPTRDALLDMRSGIALVRMLGGAGALGNGVEASIEHALE